MYNYRQLKAFFNKRLWTPKTMKLFMINLTIIKK